MRILSIFGTRPEAIKMAPLVKQLEADAGIESIVCVTGQHQQMLDQVLELFQIKPHHNLALMTGNQTLNGLASRLIASLDEVLAASRFDPKARTLFSWIASIPYVEESAVHETFQSLARLSAEGSEIIFNFGSWGAAGDGSRTVNADLERATQRRGEPLKSAFDPEALLKAVGDQGFARVALLDSKAQTERYFADRADGLHVVADSQLAHVRRTA